MAAGRGETEPHVLIEGREGSPIDYMKAIYLFGQICLDSYFKKYCLPKYI